MKAPRLRQGDTIGIITPSWGGPAVFPHRLENGIAYLESRGFKIRLGAHARGEAGFVSGTPGERVSDLHELFSSREVTAIIASIGGDHSCHLLPHLDFRLIGENPKIFMGYSDVTVLNVAIWQRTGLVTFNGPALMTDFAEYPEPLEYTIASFEKTVCSAAPPGRVDPAPEWTEEILDWRTQKDLTRPRTLQRSPGWSWLRGGTAEGTLLGGCIESLQHLRGTDYWPDWEGKVLFLETSEEKPTPARVDGILMDYENMGILGRIEGLVFGRAMFYSDEEKAELRAVIEERTKRYSFPVVTDMDFGHTAPQFVLPIGCAVRIDSDNRSFEILEAAVE